MGKMGEDGTGMEQGGARQVWMGQGWDGMAGAVGQAGGLVFYALPPPHASLPLFMAPGVRLPFLCPPPFHHTSCPYVSPHSTPGMKEPFSGALVRLKELRKQ